MVIDVKPPRGGFIRPFGTAFFIRDYLAGHGAKYGVEAIDPQRGAPQTDIHSAYKNALHRAMAENAAVQREEADARREGRRLNPDNIDRLTTYYLGRVPYKLTRMRAHSFRTYFHHLKRLGWVEETGETERSIIQDAYPPGPPRVFYRLTEAGLQATTPELSDPIETLYQYPREVRSPKRRQYVRPPAPRGYAKRRARKLARPTGEIEEPSPPAPAPAPKPARSPRQRAEPKKPPAPKRPPEYRLPKRATGPAVTRLIAHIRHISGLPEDQMEAELERIERDFSDWVDAAQEAYDKEADKETPNESRLASLEVRLEALQEAAEALGERDPYGIILALERY